MNIPYLSLQKITAMHAEEIQQAAQEVVQSGWYLQGRHIAQFEQEFALYTGALHCVSCANGLDALTLMIRSYRELGRLKEGDEVIVPANTYIATILAITENGLSPVLVEPRIDTLQIDDSLIEQAVTERTKAIMLVHLYGYNSFTEKIGDICREHNLILMQDCAQVHGLKVSGNCCWSFYPGKNLGALADAGAITTDDPMLADTFRAIANYGSGKKYVFRYRGWNSRMDELSAAVLSVKLRYLQEDNRRRQEIAEYYNDNISNSRLMLPPEGGVHHIYPVLTPERDRLQQYLASEGIGTVIHYPIPPHRQECYSQWNGLSLPVTERIHNEELSLPLNQAMTQEEVQYITEKINKW